MFINYVGINSYLVIYKAIVKQKSDINVVKPLINTPLKPLLIRLITRQEATIYLLVYIIYVFTLMVALTQRQDNQSHGWGHEPKCWQLKHTRHLHEWISIILSCHAAPEKLYKTPLHTIKFNLWTETRDEFLASGAKLVA